MRSSNVTGMPKTVHERMKLNGGIIAGPNHRFSNQKIQQAMEEGGEAKPTTQGPPNLRDAERMESCATCTHYAAQSCQKYDNTDVNPGDICDVHTPVGKVEAEDMDSEMIDAPDEDDD